MGKISENFKEIGEIQRNLKKKRMWKIFQFLENKGKFFVRPTETLNKPYKTVNVKLWYVSQNEKIFFKNISKNLQEMVSEFFEQYLNHL